MAGEMRYGDRSPNPHIRLPPVDRTAGLNGDFDEPSPQLD